MLSEEKISLTEFHGYDGPYSYIGYRMRKAALRLLTARGKKLKAIVKCAKSPPLYCIIDGIQFSTSCTFGKGNITVVDEKQAEALFQGEKDITIRLKDSIKHEIEAQKACDSIVTRLRRMDDKELFEVTGDPVTTVRKFYLRTSR